MTAIVFRAGAGVAGDVTRTDVTVVEPAYIADGQTLQYGDPVKMDGGKLVKAEDTMGFYGVLSRVVPSESGDLGQTYADGTPDPRQVQGVVVAGYVLVNCVSGDPQRGKCPSINATGFYGNSDDDLLNIHWASEGKDENGLAEIRIGK